MLPLAQSATGPLGVADATARALINGAVRDPKLSSTHAFVAAVRHAYEKLPVAARASAVTAAFVWAKSYVSSPAFTSMYAAARQQARPAGAPPEELSVEAAVKKELDELRAGIGKMKEAVGLVPVEDRPAMLAAIKENEEMIASPEFVKSTRDQVEGRRSSTASGYADFMTRWGETYPVSGSDFVKRELERFMTASGHVDFAVPITVFRSPAGAIVGFAAPVEQPYDSWMAVECMLAGREMVTAARAAVGAWLKDLLAMIVGRRTALGLMPAIPGALRVLAQTPAPGRLRRFDTAGSTGFLIDPDGRVKAWTWGADVKGFALGLDHDRLVPTYVAQDVPALRGAVAIAAVYDSPSYAVMADGRVLTWQETRPAPVPRLPKIVTLSSIGPHIIALTAEGTAITTVGGRIARLDVAVPDLSTVVAVAAGWNYFLALLKDGTIRAWGDNRSGQLGDGTTEDRARPVAVRGITSAVAVAAREDYSAALLADGTVMTWGKGHEGLGRGENNGTPNPVSRPVPGLTGITAIAAGGLHMLALHRSGGVVSWGYENVARPVGHPNVPAARPAAVPLISTARAVFAGPLSSQALLADGSFMVWGALPSLSFRVDGADAGHSSFPIPMVVKGL